MIKPPMKKPITAIKEGSCRSDKPLIACPDVQPPAYLEPKPTSIPPIAKIKNPLNVKIASKLKISSGCTDCGAEKPNSFKSEIVFSEIAIGSFVERNWFAINPPKTAK